MECFNTAQWFIGGAWTLKMVGDDRLELPTLSV